MARLRIETAPEITVYDEAFVIKAAANATAPLVQLKDSSGTVVGNISSNGVLTVASVIASSAGTSSTDLATRAYVDSIAAGMNWHEAVTAATTTVLPSCTYDNGTLGVGAYLQGSVNGALPTIDGITLDDGYGVLVKNQADDKQNGIYQVYTKGSGSSKWKLIRRSDSDNSVAGQVKPGDAVYVLTGTTNAISGFIISANGTGTANAIIFGTDSVTWSLFTGSQTSVAGAGLQRTGNQLEVITVNNVRLISGSSGIDLATVSQSNTSGSSTTSFISNISLDGYGRVTGKEVSSVSFGGYAPLNSPSFTTPSLGQATATYINNISFTQPISTSTLTLASGSTFATSGQYVTTLTSTANTSVTLPTSGTLATTSNKLSAFAATTSSELAGVISDETGTGNLVFSNTPTLVTPTIGVATATSVNKVTITAPATSATLTLANGSSLITSGAYVTTLTSTANTSVTLPTSGTLYGTASASISSAQLAASVSDETGTGNLVFSNSPVLVTPNIGTPSFANLASATGLPISTGVSGLGTGVATFLATPSSANLASALTDETGSSTLVFNTSPNINTSITTSSTTFNLINATATTVNFAGGATTLAIGSASGNTALYGNVTVGGDLTVNGSNTVINANTLAITDKNIELANVVTQTNTTASGGGVLLHGATDKTIYWQNATLAWTSSEDWDLASGKVYKINNTTVLNGTTLGSGVVTSSLTAVGNVTTGTWSSTLGAVSGASLTSLTAANLTGTIPSGVLGNSTNYIGTTAVTLSRASANLALTGISSVALPGSTSGTITLQANATAGTTTITLPATTGTVITTGDSGTITGTMIADNTIVNADIATTAAIAYSKLSLTTSIVNGDISATAAIDQGKIADTVINPQTTSYTLVLTDKNKMVEVSNAGATTLTIPADNTVNMATGATLTILQTGAGQVTLAGAAGVTVSATPGLKLRTTWSSATLIKRAANTWVALGDLSA